MVDNDIRIAGLDQAEQSALAQFDPLAAQAAELSARADKQYISTDSELKAANGLKKDLTAYTKSVKDMRMGLSRPLDQFKDSLIGRERELTEPVEAAKRTLGDRIIGYEDEQNRKRQAEADRIESIARDILGHYQPGMTKNQVEKAQEWGQEYISGLTGDDAENPTIKAALLNLSTNLRGRLTDIEIDEQRVAKKKLTDDEAKLADEKRRLEVEADRQRLERLSLDAERAKAKAERERPKSNIVEQTEFEIENESAVPTLLKTTDLKKVREYHKAYPDHEIAGIKIIKSKRVRG